MPILFMPKLPTYNVRAAPQVRRLPEYCGTTIAARRTLRQMHL
jgi:hypothetical protein